MEYCEEKGLIMVRLQQDEDLFESLKHVCRACDVRTGIFLSGIGMLKQAELSFFVKNGRYATAMFPEPLELVSLTGNVIRQDDEYVFHVHAVLARETKEAMAGHLSKGKVNVTNEIAILKTDHPARRDEDPATGLMGLNFRREG
jgi:predicted DNA-binding protein with PD1-like motif